LLITGREKVNIVQSQNKTARMAGFFYLMFIVTFILASYLRSTLIVSGNPLTTANNIIASPGILRLGFMSELISALFFLLAAWALYVLLKPVNKNLALLFLLLNLTGVAIECLNTLNLFTTLQFLGNASYLSVFSTDQLQAIAMTFLNSYTNGFMITQLFFSTWLLPLGYLVYKSHFIPKALGILLMLDFLGILSWFLQFFLLPDYAILSYPGLAISFIAEFSISLWLLIKGVKKQPSVDDSK
jgi:hypothetical protein